MLVNRGAWWLYHPNPPILLYSNSGSNKWQGNTFRPIPYAYFLLCACLAQAIPLSSGKGFCLRSCRHTNIKSTIYQVMSHDLPTKAPSLTLGNSATFPRPLTPLNVSKRGVYGLGRELQLTREADLLPGNNKPLSMFCS